MRISDWSSDVCSSDLLTVARRGASPVSAVPAEHGDGTAAVRPGSDPVPLVRAVDKPTAVRVENAPSSAAEISSIRVSIDKVDALTNKVGEWVIRQEERCVGKECVSTGRSGCAPIHQKKKKHI